MKNGSRNTGSARVVITLAASIIVPSIFAQQIRTLRVPDPATPEQSMEQKLQRVLNDKSGYATTVARRWEYVAKANGQLDDQFSTDLYNALMSLPPEKLLAAGEATTLPAFRNIVLSGIKADPTSPLAKPNILSSFQSDLVYTPITPCRIVDTRNAGGPIAANTSRSFELDVPAGGNYLAQGGSNTGCNIPSDSVNAVTAAEMMITVVFPNVAGFITAWSVLTPQPVASVLNYKAGDILGNSSIVPALPGSGADFNVFSGNATTNVVIDVLGYFAAPIATPLSCTTVATGYVAVPVNSWTNIDANCPAGYTLTGGGWDSTEGTLGYPGVWLLSQPTSFLNPGTNGWRIWVDNQTGGSRNVNSIAVCCRVPGR